MSDASAPHINDVTGLRPDPDNSSTQVGAIAECLVSAAILQASKGRLAPFRPIADDDGIDLLLFNKDTRLATSLQIKCRRDFDDPLAQIVQFDVRRKTYSGKGESYFLFVKVDGIEIKHIWLLSAAELIEASRPTPDRFICRPSCKPSAKGKLSPFKVADFAAVAARILQTQDGLK